MASDLLNQLMIVVRKAQPLNQVISSGSEGVIDQSAFIFRANKAKHPSTMTGWDA